MEQSRLFNTEPLEQPDSCNLNRLTRIPDRPEIVKAPGIDDDEAAEHFHTPLPKFVAAKTLQAKTL